MEMYCADSLCEKTRAFLFVNVINASFNKSSKFVVKILLINPWSIRLAKRIYSPPGDLFSIIFSINF